MGALLTLLVIFVAVAAFAWGARWAWRFLAIGASYKTTILSTAIFGSGRDIDPNAAPEVSADAYWFLRLFRAHVDRQAGVVTAACLGLRPQTTVWTGGAGRAGGAGGLGIPWSHGPASPPLDRVIEHAFREINPRRLRRTRAIVVVRDGRIIGERYAPGFHDHMPLPGWSMTKAVVGTLAGILVADGSLALNDRELLPEWKRPDPRADITVEDLLRMRSGLRFVENYSNPGSDVVRMLFEQKDAAAFAARLPLKHTPGTVWSYSSGTTNILCRIIRDRVGDADYLEWPRRVLFEPIGMSSAVMEPDAAGTFVGSSFMLATARDWARLGQLYLDGGMWQGRRVISENWIRFAMTPTPQAVNYGAHWYLRLNPELGGDTDEAARIPGDAFHALGHEGQTLTVVPSRSLVIVRLGLSIYPDAWNHARFVSEVLDATAS